MKKYLLPNYCYLESFELPEGTVAGEADFFYKPNDKTKLLKIYKRFSDNELELRLKSILDLDENRDQISVPGLILPNEICFDHDRFQGPVFPIKPGNNASVYLHSDAYPIKVKIEILKQIGTILDGIAKCSPSLNLAFSDVHADNFLVDGAYSGSIEHMTTYAIDTDGMRIKANPSAPNFRLKNRAIMTISKYETYKDNRGIARIMPSKETDTYCFIMMVLDIISGNTMELLSVDEFKKYLDYLDGLGFNSNLLASFASVYETDKANISPLPYLNYLSRVSRKSSYESFYRAQNNLNKLLTKKTEMI